VIHPAEMLNTSAANALLKNLEEPPPRTYFLLVTHRPHQVLPTIKSRCRQVSLALPDPAAAASWLVTHGVRDGETALAHAGGAPLLALELSGAEYWGTRAAFLRQFTARDFDVIAVAEAVRDYPVPHLVALLQKWSYDIVYWAALGRTRYNPDYHEAIAGTAARVDRLAALRFHREMVRLQRIAHHPLNARLFIENLLLAYRELVQPRATA
jgi:DNA polymerase-3 subunit delta'